MMTARSSSDNRIKGVSAGESSYDDDDELSVDDIEVAYARALEAIDAAEQAIPELSSSGPGSETGDAKPAGEFPAANNGSRHPAAAPRRADAEPQQPFDPELAGSAPEQVLRPDQVVEAGLFVGGRPLTSKRLAGMLGSESNGDAVEQAIARLNKQYAREARPYEIRLQEGGYELTLHPQFERIRDRVYGRNPKDVKLSQEALEVLAFVAYRQPVRCLDLEEAGKANAVAILQQLLRRQLVALHRAEDTSGVVTYVTTPRFLELFGLRHLDDLPLPEDLELK